MASLYSKKTIDTYNRIASSYSYSHFSTSFWKKEFSIFKKYLSQGSVLEIGCGAGRDATLFIESDYKYLGIDASSGMIREAKKRNPKAKFEVMDFYKLDFPNETFSGFWAAASLLHAPKKRIIKVLKKIRKITKKQSIGFISLKEKTLLDEGIVYEDKFGGINRYFSFYAKDEFQKILENAGFEIVKFLERKEKETNWLCFFVRRVDIVNS